MSEVAARIDLAHEAAFALGRLTVRPSTRDVARDDGVVEVLEPRVMQVLVALHRAGGGIVSRGDLTRSCWEDRVVGEDAINRVISRLRRVAGGIGERAFRVETVTKVGYRLVQEEPDVDDVRPRAAVETVLFSPSRRRVTDGAVVGIAALAGGGWWWSHRRVSESSTPSAEVRGLMEQAVMAMRQSDRQGSAQAVGIYRRVTEIAPDYAQGWGALAFAYGSTVHSGSPASIPDTMLRARAAAARALALDPANSYAQLALLSLMPNRGNWVERMRIASAAAAAHPDDEACLFTYARLLGMVGRNREGVPLLDRCLALTGPSPGLCYSRTITLWSAGRLDEADRAMEEAFALYPTHFAVWFTRFYMLAYGGRAAEAIAFAQHRDGRPNGIPESDFDLVIAQGRALLTRAPTDIDAVVRRFYAAARTAAGYAENALGFAATVGRFDDAFAFADAYFFGRGFEVGDIRFSPLQGSYTRRADRRTYNLFQPPAAAIHADPRFARLVDELQLSDFWRRSGVKPDYQHA